MNVNAVCIEGDFLFEKAKDLVDKNIKYFLTPLYIAWWYKREEIISVLKSTSDIHLNIELSKKNNHPNSLKFFESFL